MNASASSTHIDNAPYIALRHTLEEAGVFRKRPIFFSIYATLLIIGYGIGLYVITLGPILWLQTLNALFMAIVLMQMGFLGHDIAHGQVFNSKFLEHWVGSTVYGLFLGMSLDDWYGRHREHHTHTNHIDKDPDIQLPLVFTEIQYQETRAWYRTYILPHQHWYFFLFMPLAYLNYIYKSLPWDVRVLKRPIRWYELFLTIIHFQLLFYIVFAHLGLWVGLLFLGLNAIAGGAYAGFAFAPNHKGEEVLDHDQSATWQTQIITTRNIYASPFRDLALGGLNYQIEHHLFSYIPRPNLKRAQLIIKTFCAEQNLPYHETTFAESVREIYTSLRHFAQQPQ